MLTLTFPPFVYTPTFQINRSQIETIMLFTQPEPFSEAASSGVRYNAELFKITVLEDSPICNPDLSVLDEENALIFAKRIAKANPDAVIIPQQSDEVCINMMRAFKKINYVPNSISFSACAVKQNFLDELGDDARYVLGAQFWDKRLTGSLYRESPTSATLNLWPQYNDSDTPSLDKYINEMETIYDDAVNMDASLATFTGVLFHKVVQRSESLDKDVWNAVTPFMYDQCLFGRINFDTWGRVADNEVVALQIDGNRESRVLSPILSSEMEMIYPMPTWEERKYSKKSYGTSQEKGLAGLVSVALVLYALLGLVIFIKRADAAIKALTPELCYVTIAGGMMMLASTYFWTTVDTTADCSTRLWLFSLGFTSLFASLVVKTWRLLQVFNRSDLRVVKITNMDLVKYVGIFVAIETVLLLIWTIAAPMNAKIVIQDELRPSENLTTCRTDPHFLHASIGLKALFLFAGLVFAIKARNVPSMFNESQAMGLSIYNVAFTVSILVPIVMSSMGTAETMYLIRTAGITLSVSMVMGILFVPRLLLIFLTGASVANEGSKLGGTTFKTTHSTGTKVTPLSSVATDKNHTKFGQRPSISSGQQASVALQEENKLLRSQLEEARKELAALQK